MTTRSGAEQFIAPEQVPTPPAWFTGSWPEYLVYASLTETFGYADGVDFTFQSGFFGGRAELGGIVVDFVMHAVPGIAISVIDVYWHTQRDGGVNRARDIEARDAMAGIGYRLIFVEDFRVLQDADWIVSEALAGRDHSAIAR